VLKINTKVFPSPVLCAGEGFKGGGFPLEIYKKSRGKPSPHPFHRRREGVFIMLLDYISIKQR